MSIVFRRTLLLASLASLVSACATNQFSPAVPVTDGMTLSNSNLYVYSFLDIRDAEFGPTMLAEIDTQLVRELAKATVTAKVLRFKKSKVGEYYGTTNGGLSVPVAQTIQSNAEEERALGADYRLIIFPSQMTRSGSWKLYDIRWELIDIKTSKRVWVTTSHGKHLNLWKNDEDPQARAKTIVDGVMAEFQKSNLIR